MALLALVVVAADCAASPTPIVPDSGTPQTYGAATYEEIFDDAIPHAFIIEIT
jgi:hypothetical protein